MGENLARRSGLYSVLFSFVIKYNYKERGALHMDFPLTLQLEWILYNLITPLFFSQNTLLDIFLNYGTITMLNNGALSPPSRLLFNIA